MAINQNITVICPEVGLKDIFWTPPKWGECREILRHCCSHTSHLTWLGRMGAGTGGGFICKQIILLFTKTCIVFVVLFKICFIAYIYLSIFIYLSESHSLAWACCSLVLGFSSSWIITLSSCPSIQPWERGEVLITFRRLYLCSYL